MAAVTALPMRTRAARRVVGVARALVNVSNRESFIPFFFLPIDRHLVMEREIGT